MKRQNNLYSKITDIKEIKDVYDKQIRVNTKNKFKITRFEELYTTNIANVQITLQNHNYFPGQYNIFLIKEPKYRIVMSQNIGDKLINHLVAKNFLVDVLEKSLIDTNIATRVNMGTHYGIRILKRWLNELKNQEIYALKFDISKYFYSIDHEISKELIRKKIKDPEAIEILDKIIDTTNKKYINHTINKLKQREINRIKESLLPKNEKEIKISEVERIPLYENGKGLPIGNMTSQILAIYYLNELDHHIKEKLHMKYYMRYMDDGVIICSSKEELKKCLKDITEILERYKLKLNRKTKIMNVKKEGLDFLGFRFCYQNKNIVLRMRNDTKKRFKRKLKRIEKGLEPWDSALQIINSYHGHFKHGNCYNLYWKSINNALVQNYDSVFRQ